MHILWVCFTAGTFLIHTTIKFANCSETSAKLQSSSWKNMAYLIGYLQQQQQKDECFLCLDACLNLWGYQLCANSSVCSLQKGSVRVLMSMGCRESSWLVQWLFIPVFHPIIYKLCYCYPAEPCGNAPCTIRFTEEQGWGCKKEMTSSLTKRILLPLYGCSSRKRHFPSLTQQTKEA